MKILLVAATLFEIRPFLSKLANHEDENDPVLHYNLKDTSIDVLVTGMGMVQAAYYLGKQFATTRYDMAINAGIGGSYSEELKIGEVVHVTEECMTDLGAEEGENFLSLFDLGLMDPDTLPFHNGRLINKIQINTPVITKLTRVRGATSSTVHGNPESIKKVTDQFHPQEESMEGAACFYAFLSENVPFAEIRAISNFVEVRDKVKWNLELALKNLNNVLWDLFSEVCE
jgi:futalosine hydrolase